MRIDLPLCDMDDCRWCVDSNCTATEVRRLRCPYLHYTDLAEQGKLVELPCAVGDTVYTVNDKGDECYRCDFAREHKILESSSNCVDFCNKTNIEPPTCPSNHYEIRERICEGFEYLGKPLAIEDAGECGYEGIESFYGEGGKSYKTKAAAEAQLAELEGRNEKNRI